jgi:hypothetical protein
MDLTQLVQTLALGMEIVFQITIVLVLKVTMDWIAPLINALV